MMIIPAAGAFALCTVWGYERSARLKKRAELLWQLKQMVSGLEIAIGSTAPPLNELALGCGGVFGQLLRQCLGEAPGVRAAWNAAAQRLCALSYCGEEEAALVAQLGQELGTCSVQGQLAILQLHKEKLSLLHAQAERESAAKCRLFSSVGMLVGLGAAVLIL